MSLLPLRRAFTLAEVLITVAIVAVAGLAIISSLTAGVYFQQSIREENGALRLATDVIEASKRELFRDLERQIINPVTIDDRGTPETDDDVTGRAELRFYRIDGTEVGIPGGPPIPGEGTMIRVEATVRWAPAGRRHSKVQEVTLASLLAP
ncbi:MAG: hypothetical protein PWP23_2590 [Candidatus Sumerlaeota bacterium]|nr:hypothetical protein [Candidatus Sumerlaeota bacterium]